MSGADLRDEERIVRESYDRVPYPSASNHHSHPDHLATLAILHGLAPASPERCSVLELGCADGGNLIPMGVELPQSRFVGIDLSPRQIEIGRAQIASLNVPNVELHAMSILDAGPELGTFDYIICHGVFSWVGPVVQEKILEICRTNLAPNGVAFVSYNTFPGWHLRRMVRDMVRYHTRGIDEPEARTARALELVTFLAETSGDAGDAFAVFLRGTREQFEEFRDRPSYLLHEYLEETNAPVYFHEFASRAAAQGLQYLSEAEPELMEAENLSPQIAARLQSYATDRIEQEQYLDFVLNRTFRRTLLCHRDVALDASMHVERIERLYAASPTKPVSERPNLAPGVTEGFKTPKRTFSTGHPLAKSVLVFLASIWPRAASFEELPGAADPASLADLLHSLFWNGVVELHVTPPRCTNVVSARPRASTLARRQAEAGNLVTNQRRRVLKLDDTIARFLLPHLDGTKDRAALVRLLDREVSAGRLDISADGQPIREPHRIPSVLSAVLEHHLRKMAELALLVE